MQPINATAGNRAGTASSPALKGNIPTERGIIRLNAKFPAHNEFVCSYEVVIESELFKPESGRSAMLYFSGPEQTLKNSYFDYGRFFFYLPQSVQPVFEEALDNRALTLSVLIVTDNGRPARDQSQAIFRLASRDVK